MAHDEIAVTARGLTKRFGGFTAVDGVSFDVRRGEIFGILGPNGAGKTTTIRMLLGLMRPSAGNAIVLGYRMPEQAKALHARAGYMSQAFTLYNDLTPAENIRFYGKVYGLPSRELRRRRAQIIAMARLDDRQDELTENLSGGWRQRLALGCAIIHDPELVFLDEPTAGVGPVARQEFWELIYQLATGGTTVFVSTHHMDEAELCQRLGFISKGRLVAIGTPEELVSQGMWGEVVEIACDRPDAAMRELRAALATGRLDARDVTLFGARIHALVRDGAAGRSSIEALLRQAGIRVHSVDCIVPSLEDVFVARMNDARDASQTWGEMNT